MGALNWTVKILWYCARNALKKIHNTPKSTDSRLCLSGTTYNMSLVKLDALLHLTRVSCIKTYRMSYNERRFSMRASKIKWRINEIFCSRVWMKWEHSSCTTSNVSNIKPNTTSRNSLVPIDRTCSTSNKIINHTTQKIHIQSFQMQEISNRKCLLNLQSKRIISLLVFGKRPIWKANF